MIKDLEMQQETANNIRRMRMQQEMTNIIRRMRMQQDCLFVYLFCFLSHKQFFSYLVTSSFLLVEERAQICCTWWETTGLPQVNWQTCSHNGLAGIRTQADRGERLCDFEPNALTTRPRRPLRMQQETANIIRRMRMQQEMTNNIRRLSGGQEGYHTKTQKCSSVSGGALQLLVTGRTPR
jgi:hypothetical protein